MKNTVAKGDEIGPEVMDAVLGIFDAAKVSSWMAATSSNHRSPRSWAHPANASPLCGAEWLREIDGKRGYSLAQRETS